ncbi:hypothetical protein [Amycolatopsis taiwanensis]|uniref:hypothetical protein n=1 Tax=Amycolatopsis taiwanensis TaxID=342230 RepID=UPI00048063DE|nr:hypothetical protein [Amycolatopsis taiwanensis]
MSWQEELRQLDEELASGRLSADDYRVRRDQVLSSAVGQPDAQTPETENAGTGAAPDATQVIPPISPPQGMPVSPPQGMPVSPPQGMPQQQPDADRTQAVPPSWQSQPPGGDRTQYVQPQYPPSPAGGFPQAGGFQPGWNMPDQAPPWGGGELPPLGPSSGEPGWVQQGPESFDEKPSKGNGAKIAAIVGAVVVLVGVAVGAFLLWGRGSGGDGGGQPPVASDTSQQSTGQKAPDPLAIADFPGQTEDLRNITTFNDIPALNFLTAEELSTYSNAGAGPVKIVVKNLADGNRVIVLVVQANSPAAAKNAASDLLDIQVTNGARRFGDVPNGVHASAFDSGDGQLAQVRGHYAHDNKVVRIEVTGKNLQASETDFSTILSAQLKVLPANG